MSSPQSPADALSTPSTPGASTSTPAGKGLSISISSGLSAGNASRKPTASRLPRRPHQLQRPVDDDDDDDETNGGGPTFEAVTGFDSRAGGAITADSRRDVKRELVIPVTSKNNWRDRPGVNRRRGTAATTTTTTTTTRPKTNLLPKEVQALREQGSVGGGDGKANGYGHANGAVETDRPSMAYGLSYAESKPASGGMETEEFEREAKEGEDKNGDRVMRDAGPIVPSLAEDKGRDPTKPLTDDEIALRALIRESKGEVESRSDLVIESVAKREEAEEDYQENGYADVRYDETSSFRVDVASRPDPASLDAYNAVPVEEFGAALLRGMGWKEGQAIGRGNYSTNAPSDRAKQPRIPERRPGFLGIGAKDVAGAKGAEAEFGAWGKAAMRKGSRKAGAPDGPGNTEGVYMPVMMRNKKTGEVITEEELAALSRENKKKSDVEDWKVRRDHNLERSGRDSDRERDRDSRRREHDNEYSKRMTDSVRRERSPSSTDRHSRRRHGGEDDSGRDDRHYRDRDRDRDRDRNRDRDRRDRDREKDRDRERDRQRTRHVDRDREPDSSGRKSHRYPEEERHSSRHFSSSGSRHGKDRDRDRDSDREAHRRR